MRACSLSQSGILQEVVTTLVELSKDTSENACVRGCPFTGGSWRGTLFRLSSSSRPRPFWKGSPGKENACLLPPAPTTC